MLPENVQCAHWNLFRQWWMNISIQLHYKTKSAKCPPHWTWSHALKTVLKSKTRHHADAATVAKSCLEREIPSLSIVDPVLCLRKTQSTMNRPTERLCWDPPMNYRGPTTYGINLLLFNLCHFSKRLICQDFQKTFIKGNEYNIWLIGPAFRCASSFWARNDHSFSD